MKSASGDLSTSSQPLPPKAEQNRKAVDYWMTKKTMHTSAVASIRALSSNRAKSEKDMREVAIAIYAVEHLFKAQGLFQVDKADVEAYIAAIGGKAGDGDENERSPINSSVKGGTGMKQKTEDELLKELTDKRKLELQMFPHFSKWIRESKFSFADVPLSKEDLQGIKVGNEVYKLLKLDLLKNDSRGDATILESLSFIAIRSDDKKKADKTTVVTNKLSTNDLFCNYIYMRELKKVWSDAKKELQTRLQDAISSKRDALKSRDKGGRGGAGQSGDEGSTREVSETNVLKSFGLLKLKTWIDEDEKVAKVEKERDEHEKRLENNNQFASYLHKAVYGKEDKHGGGAKADDKDDDDDEDKYADGPIDGFASSKGKKGVDKEKDKRVFSDWLLLKDMRDQALACLKNIDNPLSNAGPSRLSGSFGRSSRDYDAAATLSSSLRKSADKDAIANIFQSLSDSDKIAVRARAILVGKNLKKIDRTLFSNWVAWLGEFEIFAYRGKDGQETVRFGVDSRTVAGYLWDSFRPISCDLHSSAMSQIKDSFMKMMKPNVNFEEIFEAFKKTQKGRKRDSPFLNRDEMREILQVMKVTMKETDILALIDAFDSAGKGVISKEDFINFSGPVMSKKCCWRTTCPTTGMSNAFSVSMLENVRPVIKGPPPTPKDDDFYDDDAKSSAVEERQKDDFKSTRVVASSERKIVRELPDRRKRELVLKEIYASLGDNSFAADSKSSSSKVGAEVRKEKKDDAAGKVNNGSNNDDENYEDDFEEPKTSTKADAKDAGKEAGKGKGAACAYSAWDSEQRVKGLSVLLNLSAGNKKQELLSKALLGGKPPSPPKVWFEVNHDVGKMTLRWGPANNDDNNVITSFYSVEFGGSVSSKTNVFEEVFNDPPNLGDEFGFKFVAQNLKPGCKYVFRVRAFNGFGSSSYTFITGITVDSKPSKPRIVKLSNQSVTLSWESGITSGGTSSNVASSFDSSIKYVVEKCLSEVEESWVQIQETSRCFATIARLAPATSYRFRVYSKASNADSALCSQPSDDVIVHTSLDTPETLVNTIVSKDTVGLNWTEGSKAAANDAHSKINQWSGMVDKNPCISLEYLFSKFDPECKGLLPRTDLKEFLLDLGVDPTEDRLRRVLQSCNSRGVDNEDKKEESAPHGGHVGNIESISLEKFASWWYDEDNIVYCVYKSEPVPPSSSSSSSSNAEAGDKIGSGQKQTAADLLKLKDVPVSATRPTTASVSAMALAGAAARKSNIRPKSASAAASSATTKKAAPSGIPKKVIASTSAKASDKDAATPRYLSSNSGDQGFSVPTPCIYIESIEHIAIKNRTRHYGYDVTGLKPNTLYHFRLQTIGPKSVSFLSNPVIVMTTPDRPSTPVLIGAQSTKAHVKWYAPKGGCFKFRVECRIQASSTEHWGDWATVCASQETLWAPTTLSPNKHHEVRIVAVNFLGLESQPSDSLRFKTKARAGSESNESSITSPPLDIDGTFPIDSTGDICIGDTILLTEYLYSTDKDRENQKICLGERTIAAIVYRDNYRSIRRSPRAVKVGDPGSSSDYGALVIGDVGDDALANINKRKIGLQVVWERCSNACKPYSNRPGDIIERATSSIEQFEVFRMSWSDERYRRPLKDEWALLDMCFHSS